MIQSIHPSMQSSSLAQQLQNFPSIPFLKLGKACNCERIILGKWRNPSGETVYSKSVRVTHFFADYQRGSRQPGQKILHHYIQFNFFFLNSPYILSICLSYLRVSQFCHENEFDLIISIVLYWYSHCYWWWCYIIPSARAVCSMINRG